ncbi:MAG: hypothetical protein ACO1TE_19585 [Prosthecobacter sp.]
MTLEDCFDKYGEPLYVGSKHLIWKDTEQNRAVKATRPGYLADGCVIITSQPWHEPADASAPHPSTEEMTEYLQSFGFSQVSLDDWRRVDGIMARNVKPCDFIKTRDAVVPIDVCLDKP